MQHHTQPGPAMPTESFPTDPLGCRRRPAPRSWSWPPATPSSCGSVRSPNGWATPRCGCSATTAPYPVPPSRSNRAPRGTVASLATRRSSETAGMRRRRPRSSFSAICLCRLPLSTRCHRARGPLVPALRPVLPRCRGVARRAWCRGRPRDGLPVGPAVHPPYSPTLPGPADTPSATAGRWTRPM